MILVLRLLHSPSDLKPVNPPTVVGVSLFACVRDRSSGKHYHAADTFLRPTRIEKVDGGPGRWRRWLVWYDFTESEEDFYPRSAAALAGRFPALGEAVAGGAPTPQVIFRELAGWKGQAPNSAGEAKAHGFAVVRIFRDGRSRFIPGLLAPVTVDGEDVLALDNEQYASLAVEPGSRTFVGGHNLLPRKLRLDVAAGQEFCLEMNGAGSYVRQRPEADCQARLGQLSAITKYQIVDGSKVITESVTR